MRFAITAALLFLASAAALYAGAQQPQPAVREWTVDGVARKGLVHAPAAAKQAETPVVFAFHGHGGNMNQASRSFGYHTVWPEAIVVYLQGLNTPGKLTDPEGLKSGWQHSLGDQKDRDLKFFDVVLASLKKDYKVDLKRVYCTGHSNGGGFTYLLCANRWDVFAAVAPSGATPGQGWKDLKAKPILHLAGENDPLVKFEWQKTTIDVVRKLNGCEEQGKPWASAGTLVGTEYPSKTGTPLVTVLHPGGHEFPAEGAKLIVRFFKENAKR